MASATSSIVTRRPSGVRCTCGWSGTSRHLGLSPTTPGCSALMRCGAISIARVLIRPLTPPLNVVTTVDPGVRPILGDTTEQHHRSTLGERADAGTRTILGVAPTSLTVPPDLDGLRPGCRTAGSVSRWACSIPGAVMTRLSTSPTSARALLDVLGPAPGRGPGLLTPEPISLRHRVGPRLRRGW